MDRRSNIYKNSGNNCDKNFQKFTTKIQFQSQFLLICVVADLIPQPVLTHYSPMLLFYTP